MVNIRDVAKKAGVAPGTVSRVLNSDPTLSVNEQTRERIYQICQELNYRPRKYQTKKKAQSVGIISAISRNLETQDSYYKKLREKTARTLKFHNIKIDFILFPPYMDTNWNRVKTVDCVIIMGCLEKNIHEEIHLLNPNLIIVDDHQCNQRYTSVSIDLYNEMWEIMDHVHRLGHQNITFITGPSSRLDSQGNQIEDGFGERGAAYLDWLKVNNLTEHQNIMVRHSWYAQSGWDAADQLLQEKTLPTAIIAGSDLLAMGIMKRLIEAKIDIPEKVSICSFDDLEIASFMSPSLTTLKIDLDEMIYWIGQLCAHMIFDTNYSPTRVVLSGKLILRDSLTLINKSSS